jgi:hypothetical protein
MSTQTMGPVDAAWLHMDAAANPAFGVMGISPMNCTGVPTLALRADARLVPNPHTITQAFNREFNAMRRAARGKRASRRRIPAATR